MCYSSKKIVAVFLAIWLPLFSGNALAASVAMQTQNGDCHAMAVPASVQHPHHATIHQHTHDTQLAMIQDHAAGAQDQQDSSQHNCGVCHQAYCGYMAAIAIAIAEIQPMANSFELSLPQFQSITLSSLDPPPIVRA
ncbi:MAG: DUF2946 domain-containing protein [Nitrosomonadales bacterium]|nr:DUF2946 domain-containing protein [Nitrosomonadales bacterium]